MNSWIDSSHSLLHCIYIYLYLYTNILTLHDHRLHLLLRHFLLLFCLFFLNFLVTVVITGLSFPVVFRFSASCIFFLKTYCSPRASFSLARLVGCLPACLLVWAFHCLYRCRCCYCSCWDCWDCCCRRVCCGERGGRETCVSGLDSVGLNWVGSGQIWIWVWIRSSRVLSAFFFGEAVR